MKNHVLLILIIWMLRLAYCFNKSIAFGRSIGSRILKRLDRYSTSLRLTSANAGIHFVDRLKCAEIKICVNDEIITILEAVEETQEALINIALEAQSDNDSRSDPYGSVLWPAARVVSLKLSQIEGLSHKTVLELGSGTGLVGLFAAKLAKRVIASDFSEFCIQMIKKAVALNDIHEDKIKVIHFDVKDFTIALPKADVVVLADVLYDKHLGIAVAHRVYEALMRGNCVIVGDSPTRQGREPFLNELRKLVREKTPRIGLNESAIQFEWVMSETLTTFRNTIISESNTKIPEPVKIGILCL